ncbi:MAG: hypothetical protein PUE30_08085 [Spirochaetia bacterium]|uniref:hypothetical protein n=1 Tax=Treponema berlinense TaxID=225004 RepID=UPI0015BA9B17|nr:hypothetical protein [Treponema berlinense]MDD5790459.1 hypothetical protein [Spirochaetia bacterium]
MTANSKSISNQYSDRVLELRRKIHDSEYVDYAVQRIAQVLSRKLVEDTEHLYDGRKHGSR